MRMDSLMQMQRRMTVTVHHPPLLLRWVLAAIFAATTLGCLREVLYWLVFSIQYAGVSDFLASGLGHLVLYAVLGSLAEPAPSPRRWTTLHRTMRTSRRASNGSPSTALGCLAGAI
jgi:hypothetical protein